MGNRVQTMYKSQSPSNKPRNTCCNLTMAAATSSPQNCSPHVPPKASTSTRRLAQKPLLQELLLCLSDGITHIHDTPAPSASCPMLVLRQPLTAVLVCWQRPHLTCCQPEADVLSCLHWTCAGSAGVCDSPVCTCSVVRRCFRCCTWAGRATSP